MTLPQITPRHFLRYRRQLRAFLIGHEAWFSTRDLRRLLNTDLHERLLANLCDDQRQRVHLRTANGGFEEETVVSESGLHALLFTYCYHPGNRNLRRWVTQAVLPELWMYRTQGYGSVPV
ncbi:Bro-N domain-containing protein [Pseudomonas tohonis]|uniref:BRO-N domain-containing protein n=1 Tax=Pseudomonas tohonis TaxID=2725477 RepID=UPI0022EFF01B|nr:BRO family protein [Pseudomonas tohonis]